MAANSSSKLQGQIVMYLALNGSKAFFAGLDQMPANFETLGEKAQEAALKKCQKTGSDRKAAWNKNNEKLAKQGKAQYLNVTINGVEQRGELGWNSEKTGLVARVLCAVTTGVVVGEKKLTKSTPARGLAASLGL